LKKHRKCSQRSEPTMKRTKARGPVQRDTKEVMAEVLGKLTGKLDAPAVSTSAKENRRGNTVGPNRDRLTVGVDLGDRWSQYCILGLEGETLAEGQLRTTQEDVREFFQALTVARVVIEVGTHSAWVQDVITEWGHEVLVANPRLMEGSKRRKRRAIASMPTSWHDWGGWIRSRCTRFGIAVEKCARTWWCCEPGMHWCRCGRS